MQSTGRAFVSSFFRFLTLFSPPRAFAFFPLVCDGALSAPFFTVSRSRPVTTLFTVLRVASNEIAFIMSIALSADEELPSQEATLLDFSRNSRCVVTLKKERKKIAACLLLDSSRLSL